MLGDQDPDIFRLAADHANTSPTVSMAGRTVTLQLAASHCWELDIEDVDGAFLNSDLLSKCAPERVAAGGLFCEQPPDGIPGVPEGALIKLERSV